MNGLMVIVMAAAAALCADVSVSLTSTHTEEQEILNALRGLSRSSIEPAAKISRSLCGEKEQSADGKFPGTGWRMCDLLRPKTIAKRQDGNSYNLNSFGLRYGKRQHS
uniref:Kisspeptin n=1 Tax=Labrus bergylta TaxID=56723 RepID=A0A3Q3EGV1_9LABR